MEYYDAPIKLNRTTAAKLAQFLGRDIIRLCILGSVIGFAIFGVELAFVIVLQAFFSTLGIMKESSAYLPNWLPVLKLRWVVLALFFFGALRGVFSWAQSYTQSLTFERFVVQKRKDILNWVFSSKSVSSAEVTLLFNTYLGLGGTALMSAQTLIVFVSLAFTLFLSLAVTAPIVTVVAIGTLALFMYPLRRIDQQTREISKVAYAELESSYWRLLSGVKNLLLIQIHGTQGKEASEISRGVSRYSELNLRNSRAVFFKGSFPQIIGILIVCILAVLGKKTGELSDKTLIPYLYLFLRFAQAVSGGVQTFSLVYVNWAPLRRLANWWSSQKDSFSAQAYQVHESRKGVDAYRTPVGWSLQDVEFSYAGADVKILEHFSLEVKPGTSIVIKGPSGSGKSTILSIMVGILEASRGKIEILNGEKRQSIDDARPSLFQSLGYVGPESFLIEGSILENLSYGLDRVPSSVEVTQAIVDADCAFIFKLPKQLEHFITDQGQGLSAGQKQRLSLARALLRKPMALILDEPTSNLDEETEERLCSLFQTLKGKMTLVIVTHRSALLKIADQVLTVSPRANVASP